MTFDELEELLARRLEMVESGKGHWAECMQAIETYKDEALSASQKALKEARVCCRSSDGEHDSGCCRIELDAALKREKEAVKILREYEKMRGGGVDFGGMARDFLSTLPPSAAKRKHDKYCNKMGNGMCGDPKCPNKEADLPPSAPCPMLMAHNADGTPTPGCTCPKSEAA